MNSATHFLDHLHELPTVPKVVRELLDSFRREDATIESIAQLISSDPVIAAKVLRLANSAFYRRPRGIRTVQDAVMFIGLHAARTVVLGAGLAGNVKCPPGFERQAFWRYSLHTGVAARYFARCAGHDADTAFAVGLVHAIGEPLMYTAMSAQLTSIDSSASFFDEQRREAETAALGFCFSDVSADLAQRWKFPDEMVEAIRHSGECKAEPNLGDTGAFVALGAQVAAAAERGKADAGSFEALREPLEAAGLPWQCLEEMPPLAELAQGLEEMVA